jgi:Zn-dependent M28 family amino/carboxypeptidase
MCHCGPLTGKSPITRLPGAVLLTAAILSGQSASLDPTVQEIVAEISPDRVAATVKTLAGFETRGNYSDPNQKTRGIGAARRWISTQFRGYSPRLRVADEIGKWKSTDIVNIVAVLPGITQSEKRILVVAHYDSINLGASGSKAAEAPAPGADDDASGTAVVLELARVMSQYRFRKTIVFIAFGGEEIGLVGSTRYAAAAKASNEQIEAVFNNDVVGTNLLGRTHSVFGVDEESADADGDTGNLLNIYSADSPEAPSRRLAHDVQKAAQRYVPRLRIELVSGTDRFGREGDQLSFQRNGFAAVRLTSASENTVVHHTVRDTPDGISASFTADVARVNAAAVASLAVPISTR